jgi:hypothetical protein
MGYKLKKTQRDVYFGVQEFTKRYTDESDCEKELLEIKYPNGYCCKKCGNDKYYRLKGKNFKRSRLIQCTVCKKQESITTGTIFHGSKLPLLKWFWAFFFVSQTKKGISASLLSKQLKVAYSTALLMLYKIRRDMEENAIKYKIGGPGKIVLADEIEIGGFGSQKQAVLILLEKEKNKIGRVRFAPIPDKTTETIEKNLVPQIEKGTTLHVDGRKAYFSIKNRNYNPISDIVMIAHREEYHSHEFVKDLNKIVGNLKTWYRGIHCQFAPKNTQYYLNEFAYRFNRRRSEVNIFDRFLKRAITRSKIMKMSRLRDHDHYLPLAA